MSLTKRKIILMSYDELALAGFVYDLSPDELESARRKLDAMVAMIIGSGISLPYLLPATQDGSDLDQPSLLPDWATQAIYLMLAKRISPSFGKTMSDETKSDLIDSYAAMVKQAVGRPPHRHFPSTLPLGAGNRRSWYGGVYGRNFFPIPESPFDERFNTEIDFN